MCQMFLTSKARSPKLSPTSYRLSSRPLRRTAIEQRPTSDLTAFDQYSRAKTLILVSSTGSSAPRNFTQAIELLNSAVARDSSFHAAFCQLVNAHDVFVLALRRSHCRRGWRRPKLLCNGQPSCGPMLPKRTWCEDRISILRFATTSER